MLDTSRLILLHAVRLLVFSCRGQCLLPRSPRLALGELTVAFLFRDCRLALAGSSCIFGLLLWKLTAGHWISIVQPRLSRVSVKLAVLQIGRSLFPPHSRYLGGELLSRRLSPIFALRHELIDLILFANTSGRPELYGVDGLR